jgi:hypothetical protein
MAAMDCHYRFTCHQRPAAAEDRVELVFAADGTEALQIKTQGSGLSFANADALSEYLLWSGVSPDVRVTARWRPIRRAPDARPAPPLSLSLLSSLTSQSLATRRRVESSCFTVSHAHDSSDLVRGGRDRHRVDGGPGLDLTLSTSGCS